MSSEKTKWHSLPWILVVVGAILSPIFTDIYNKVPIYTSFLWIMNFEIKIWLLIILSVIIALLILLYKKIRKNPPPPMMQTSGGMNFFEVDTQRAENEFNIFLAKQESMLSYTADKFEGLIWKWDWVYNPVIKRYEVKNAKPLCNKSACEYQPLEDVGYDEEWDVVLYRCKNCNAQTSTEDTSLSIQEAIENKYSILQSENRL